MRDFENRSKIRKTAFFFEFGQLLEQQPKKASVRYVTACSRERSDIKVFSIFGPVVHTKKILISRVSRLKAVSLRTDAFFGCCSSSCPNSKKNAVLRIFERFSKSLIMKFWYIPMSTTITEIIVQSLTTPLKSGSFINEVFAVCFSSPYHSVLSTRLVLIYMQLLTNAKLATVISLCLITYSVFPYSFSLHSSSSCFPRKIRKKD